jgi:hypothetical protein
MGCIALASFAHTHTWRGEHANNADTSSGRVRVVCLRNSFVVQPFGLASGVRRDDPLYFTPFHHP